MQSEYARAEFFSKANAIGTFTLCIGIKAILLQQRNDDYGRRGVAQSAARSLTVAALSIELQISLLRLPRDINRLGFARHLQERQVQNVEIFITCCSMVAAVLFLTNRFRTKQIQAL